LGNAVQLFLLLVVHPDKLKLNREFPLVPNLTNVLNVAIFYK
jgi:hypothetical protein